MYYLGNWMQIDNMDLVKVNICYEFLIWFVFVFSLKILLEFGSSTPKDLSDLLYPIFDS